MKKVEEIIIKALDSRGVTSKEATNASACISYSEPYKYCYDSRFWSVPRNFIFPQGMLLKHAWIAWFQGYPDYCEKNAENNILSKPVQPLRKITPAMLPKKLCHHFRNSIFPIMKLMESAREIHVPQDGDTSDNFINESFTQGINHAKSIVSYVFTNENWSKSLIFAR